MRRFTFLCLLAISATLPYMEAAPAPKRTNARPAVIKAGTETYIQWVRERVISCAHIAILRDPKVAELAIVRSHVSDPKETRELIAWLERNFRVERVKGKNHVQIGFQDGDAKEQAAIINVVVDDFLKNQVGSRRETEKKWLERSRALLAAPITRRQHTAEELAKAEEDLLKKSEEYLQTLPALVEHAKVP